LRPATVDGNHKFAELDVTLNWVQAEIANPSLLGCPVLRWPTSYGHDWAGCMLDLNVPVFRHENLYHEVVTQGFLPGEYC
jgi:RES domain-containing protein